MSDRSERDPRMLRGGGAVYGAALAAFGTMNLVRLDGVPGIEPFPDAIPWHPFWSVLSGLVLLGAGAALVSGWRARTGARVAAAMFAVWLVCLHGPPFVAHPTAGNVWVPACEVLALAAAGWALAQALGDRDAPVARLVFGATFVAFGASHALYLGYVESVIPSWLPAPRFWALATGAAHLAAGLSLLTRVRARLAATLLAVMFGSWVVMLHAPRVAAHPTDPREWASLIVALAMCGSALVTAGTLRRAAALHSQVRRADVNERPVLARP